MNLHSEKIGDDIYAIFNRSENYIYAPLAGMFVECESSDIPVMKSILAGTLQNPEYDDIAQELRHKDFMPGELISDPKKYAKMSILANYKCNLSCSYCYSAKGRSNIEINQDQLNAALDFFISHARQGEKRSLFFSGGGEPLLSWKIIRPALERVIESAQKSGINLEVHFMTNGTIYRPDISKFLKDNSCTLCFSYEILESLQSNIRGKYSLVSDNLKRYLDDGNTVLISSTITPESVDYLREMVDSIVSRFPGINTVTMEPVTGSEIYETPENLAEFYDCFDKNFMEACSHASAHGISLQTSIQGVTDNYVKRYCPGKLCLTPMGTFTICHCASSPQEDRFERCRYGRIDEDGSVHFDNKKFQSLIATNCTLYDECKDCFARVHCGGECLTRRDSYPKAFMDEVCKHTRKNVFLELKKALTEND